MSFADHFSVVAPVYAHYRPRYPDALFEYLASVAPACDLAWDCGTGNGQAAIGLAKRFRQVWATDASAEQLAQAERHERIVYVAESAERASLADATVDLVTVAVAIHWFDLDRFYPEVRRVLKPDGVVAAWAYQILRITPDVDRVIDYYYRDVLGTYWPPGRRHVDEGYANLPFPFAPLDVPAFDMTADWTLDQVVGFLATWSAAARYLEVHGRNPFDEIRTDLASAWGDPATSRHVRWPLRVRVGRK